MTIADRILGLRVLHGERPLFDVGVVSLDNGDDAPADDRTAAHIARSIRGTRVTVRILTPRGDATSPVSPNESILVAPSEGGLFRGVLRVFEDSTLLLRSHAAEDGKPFDVTVFEFGVGEGFATIPGNKALRTLTFTNGVGQASIGHARARLPLLVLSRKLPIGSAASDPLEPLERLVGEVWERHLALVRRLKALTTMDLGSSRGARRSPIQTLMLLDDLVFASGVADAWDQLSVEPRMALRIAWPVRRVEFARHPVLFGPRGPSTIPGETDSAAPRRARDRTATRSTNTPANRLALRLARRIGELAASIAPQLASIGGTAAAWEARARAVRARAESFCHQPVMSEVDTIGGVDLDAPALRLDPLCRSMVRAWTMLEEGAALPPSAEALFRDPLKESFELYEYWCWFALCDAVKRHTKTWHLLGQPVTQAHAVRSAELPWSLRLLGSLHDGRTVEVHYNAPPYGEAPYRSYSIPFRPDLALLVRSADDADLLLFDAKYRVDVVTNFETTDPTGDSMKRAERRGMSKHDDLKAMHAYRDALRCVDTGRPPRWVLALFPGTETRLYPAAGGGRFASDVEALRGPAGGIGAVPAGPGNVGVLGAAVDALLARPC